VISDCVPAFAVGLADVAEHVRLAVYCRPSGVLLLCSHSQARSPDLTKPRAEGGHGLPELAPEVVTVRRELERAQKEFTRLTTLREDRGARRNITKRLESRARDWVLRGGIPANCWLDVVEDAPLSELLKKGERIADAVEKTVFGYVNLAQTRTECAAVHGRRH
jgi:hypothetical protein